MEGRGKGNGLCKPAVRKILMCLNNLQASMTEWGRGAERGLESQPGPSSGRTWWAMVRTSELDGKPLEGFNQEVT